MEHFIERTGSPERLAVVYTLPDGQSLDVLVTEWKEPLRGRFMGFDKLDPKWSWVHGGKAPVVVDGNRAYVLSAVDSEGNFTLEPRHGA